MTHLKIELSVSGDEITAISQSLDIAKSFKKDLELKLRNGQYLTIRPESHIQDLIKIAALENHLMEEKNRL